ncbi:hypothetical protein [Cupriavidus sp. M-11]|uniref:hypothetical protein n=1 Tax=Cupriavidus sp. M-11 TaxID=3233038 RepID=UPI003F8F9C5E
MKTVTRSTIAGVAMALTATFAASPVFAGNAGPATTRLPFQSAHAAKTSQRAPAAARLLGSAHGRLPAIVIVAGLGKRDPFTDGAHGAEINNPSGTSVVAGLGKRDPFTDGAHGAEINSLSGTSVVAGLGKRDPFTDGAHGAEINSLSGTSVVAGLGKRDPFTDGARTDSGNDVTLNG